MLTANTCNERQLILTRGDNNDLDDTALYPPGQSFVYREQINGVVRGYIPYAGWLTIAIAEYSWVRITIVAVVFAIAVLD